MMLSLLLALVAPAAHARNLYMYGVGPVVSTIVYPGRYPASFPGDTTNLEQFRGDVEAGLRGSVYLDLDHRLGARGTFGFGGGGWHSTNLLFEYDQVLVRGKGAAAFGGIGGGFGTQGFATDAGGDLKMATYLLRGQVGANYRDGHQAYELALAANIVLPGVQEYTAAGATEASQVKGGFYSNLTMELSVLFGDLTPPSKKNKNKSRKHGKH